MEAHPVLSASGLAFPFLFKSTFCTSAKKPRKCGQSLFSRIPNGDMPIKVWLVLCFYSDVLFLKLDLQVFEFPKRFLFAGIRCLHDASSRSKHDGFGWYLKNRILTAMHGSGQRHESWVPLRIDLPLMDTQAVPPCVEWEKNGIMTVNASGCVSGENLNSSSKHLRGSARLTKLRASESIRQRLRLSN